MTAPGHQGSGAGRTQPRGGALQKAAALPKAAVRPAVREALPWLLCSAALLLAPAAQAQRRNLVGMWEYQNSCASCHGTAGRGDGPLVRHLVTPPTDLTLLALRNGGVFPRERLVEIIDGRGSPEIGPHGSREMPIWGSAFREQAREAGSGELRSEQAVRRRLRALVDHLAELQQK